MHFFVYLKHISLDGFAERENRGIIPELSKVIDGPECVEHVW